MNDFVTKHLTERGQTIAKVRPEDIDENERRLIMEGSLGYCEGHHNLYRRVTMDSLGRGDYGLIECPVIGICCKCPDPTHTPKLSDFPPCKEWIPPDPKRIAP